MFWTSYHFIMKPRVLLMVLNSIKRKYICDFCKCVCVCVCVCVCISSATQLCLTFCNPWTAAHQALLSMEFSRQEYWSGLPFHSAGDLSDPGIEPRSPAL